MKGVQAKRGKLRKDRYSSLIIANSIARSISRSEKPIEYEVIGGADGVYTDDKKLYKGPDWFVGDANEDIYLGIYKK